MMKPLVFVCLLSCTMVFSSCGGNNNDDLALPAGGGGGAASGPAVAATATVKGKIAFEGEAPMLRKISTSSDPKCMNPDLRAEDTVVTDGGLENVIIYVSSGLEGKSFPQNNTEVLLDQEGCHYRPHALTVQTNQPIKIRNSDDTAHNIHAWAEKNASFNESQVSKGAESIKKFDKEEIMLPIRCDVHNWMNAFVGVFAHPFHTVSKAGGAYEMKLPAGKFEITAIHEKLGKKTMMVEVADNASVDLNFSFSATDKADD